METIMILAEGFLKALAKAGSNPEWCIVRMDIQYNTIDELYHGRVWYAPEPDAEPHIIRDIHEDGTIDAVSLMTLADKEVK